MCVCECMQHVKPDINVIAPFALALCPAHFVRLSVLVLCSVLVVSPAKKAIAVCSVTSCTRTSPAPCLSLSRVLVVYLFHSRCLTFCLCKCISVLTAALAQLSAAHFIRMLRVILRGLSFFFFLSFFRFATPFFGARSSTRQSQWPPMTSSSGQSSFLCCCCCCRAASFFACSAASFTTCSWHWQRQRLLRPSKGQT